MWVVLQHHHHPPSGPLLVAVIALAVLYVAARTGRLGRLRTGWRAARVRQEMRGVRVSPLGLVPLAVLVVVVVVLVAGH
ncbi:MAG TPA: hypothetical protein VFN36_07900 [Solirubrobacteraceae bacterium]|nr:hypothetical protein [Solirubrobacteraceae bacterium]